LLIKIWILKIYEFFLWTSFHGYGIHLIEIIFILFLKLFFEFVQINIFWTWYVKIFEQ